MIGRGSRILPHKKRFKIVDLGNNSRRFGLWQLPIDWRHVFAAPHLYLEHRYKDEWDYELEHDYQMPEEIKARFLNSSAEEFIVRDVYHSIIKKGQKPQTVLELSMEDHFGRIKDNASSYEEALELYNLLSEEVKYRMRQFSKLINATPNYIDWQYQNYMSKLKRRLFSFFG